MDIVGVCSQETNILEELKSNTMMPNYLKIKTYKDYLLNEKKYYYPDMLLEWVAREHLGLQRTEEELKKMREEYLDKMKQIEIENEIGEEEVKNIEAKNKIKIL